MVETTPQPVADQRGPKNLVLARAVVGLSGPAGLGIVILLGWVVMHSFNLELYQREMCAAVIISLVAGFVAVLPLLAMMHRGAIAIVRLTMLGMILRMALTLGGLILATGPGWKLSILPLVAWIGACYLGLLVAESSATAWVVRH